VGWQPSPPKWKWAGWWPVASARSDDAIHDCWPRLERVLEKYRSRDGDRWTPIETS
jgi:hypothetical protein